MAITVSYSTDGHRAYRQRGAGSAKKRRVTQQAGGDRTAFKPAKMVAYCPDCPRSNTDPQGDVKLVGPWKHKHQTLRCPKGHVFVTNGGPNA